MRSNKYLAHYRICWEVSGSYIIGFDKTYNCYAVWQKEPLWYEYNSVSEYFKTIEETRLFINNLS